jgi:tetratricopeptide (TPR) repeat protein
MASSARLDELKRKFEENPRRYFAPLANEHRKSGDLDQAIALCRTHLPQQPAHISGHIVLAQALFEAGSLDESREIFHTALGLDPENLIALRYLGDIARDSEDLATARGWYQRVLEVDPRNDEIVQLVRDLDAPRPAAADELPVPEQAAVDATPTDVPEESAAVAVADNPRFAPLSLEHIDFDLPSEAPASQPPGSDGSTDEEASEASLDVPAAVNAESPTTALPSLDAPELDAFEVHPSASAESLIDASTEPPHDDPFGHDLPDLSAPDYESEVDPEYSVGAKWGASAEAEPTPTAPASEATFDNDSLFYLEPPPEQPAESAVAEARLDTSADDAMIEAAAAETATWEMPAATADESTPEVAEPELQSVAHGDTHEALGLEVMEFVPPPRNVDRTPEPVAGSASDSMLGRTPDLAADDYVEQGAPPAAFVTETMAELYLQQGFRNEALAVYRELLARHPADSSLRERIEQIEAGSLSSIGIASVSEDVVESALRRHSAKPTRSVRSFFASLAGRRAPLHAPPADEHMAPDVSAFAPVEETSTEGAADAMTDPLDASADPGPTEQDSSVPERSAPITSAAEALADFDPFADAIEMSTPAPGDTMDAAPNAAAPGSLMPGSEDPAPSSPEYSAPGSSLDELFPDAPVTARAEAVAQTLATAFGRDEPQGRPTRAASSELSLDKVFRGPHEGAPPADGGFSFDQFFSDARPSGGDVAAPAMSPPETGRGGGGAGDAHDIEQFTAWLEGLKKK